MSDTVQLNGVRETLAALSYPITSDQASDELEGTTLVLADGEANLGSLVERSTVSEFESPADLEAELHNVLPREAVGEPYQSEGEG
ncbi:hypothetical protein OB905_04720 [Halobacteria archaeon AArc-dxtr1]|nr:hypothetical protein [Halobacteria archaeon AArc-dxtr1]